MLDQPHVHRRPAEGRHPPDALGQERRGGEDGQQRADDDHLDGGGVERAGEERGEDQRHRPHLQQDREEQQHRRQHLGLPAPRADGKEMVHVVRVEVRVAREQHQDEGEPCHQKPGE
jgi:hypothetical protein